MPSDKDLTNAIVDRAMGRIRDRKTAMPTPDTSITVESCLAELREMFPGQAVSIEFRDYRGVVGCEDSGYVRVSSGTAQRTEASLSEAMVQLRAEIVERRQRGEEV